MARRGTAALMVGALLVLLAVSSAFAAPCIECKDCKTNNCFRNCQAKCPPTVSGDDCRRRGQEFGRKAARDACDSTRKFCNGGQRPFAARMHGGIGQVSRKQCANIAYGACQQTAMDRRQSPCGHLFNNNRVDQCTRKQFMDFYTAEVNDLCAMLVSSINN